MSACGAKKFICLAIGTGKIAPFIDSTGNKVWDLRRFIKPVVRKPNELQICGYRQN